MDRMRDFASDTGHEATESDEDYAVDAPAAIGTDERRMHVRAYNHWVSLLGGRALPSIEDLNPEELTDFGPNSVLLDFTGGADNPAIAYLGAKLHHECGFEEEPLTVADVPARSLLSRLTDHYLQIIANRAPIGFEAEFVNTRGHNTMYRGILMPLSTDDDTIDFVYGVINWKEVVSGDEADTLNLQLSSALAAQSPRPTMPVWADGPSSETDETPGVPQSRPEILGQDFGAGYGNDAPIVDEEEDFREQPAPVGVDLADWLATARASAEVLRSADSRGRTALYHALGHAYDFALLADVRKDDYLELLSDSGIVGQDRAPMTPIVKLVFGTDYDKTRLTEFAAALSYGKRHGLPTGGMRVFLEQYPGGLKAIVAADRRERRPEGKPVKEDKSRDVARALDTQAVLTLPGDDEFVVLVARRIDGERVGIIGVVPDDKAMMDRALRSITG
jgi:hypothetical protein